MRRLLRWLFRRAHITVFHDPGTVEALDPAIRNALDSFRG